MSRSTTTRWRECLPELACFVALLFVLPGVTTGDESEGPATVLHYVAEMDGEQVGSSKAVYQKTPQGHSLSIDALIQTEILGSEVKITSSTKVKYDEDARATWFDIENEKPLETLRVQGRRTGDGFHITRTRNGKTKKLVIPHEDYDHVSIEPTLWGGEVGSKEKVRLLLAGKGKVEKATIWILDRGEKEIDGKTVTVTHYRIKTSAGKVEEWRSEDSTILKSVFTTPIGKIVIRLTKIESG